MAYEHNDIATKNRLRAALEESNMGFEHNDIVTVDVMNKAIAEGGGGGASAFNVTLAYAEGSKKVKFEATGYDSTYGMISESVIKIGDDYYASTEGLIDAGEYEVLPLFDGGAGYFGTIGDDTMATVTGDASIVFIEDISSYYVKATGPCTITVNYPS